MMVARHSGPPAQGSERQMTVEICDFRTTYVARGVIPNGFGSRQVLVLVTGLGMTTVRLSDSGPVKEWRVLLRRLAPRRANV